MDFTHFTIMQDGSAIGSSAALPQAVATATHHAADTGRPVTVMAHVVGGGARRAVFNPDGANEHIWDIDKGRPLTPTVRQVYMNRSGGRYLCLALVTDQGILYFNAAGGSSSTSGIIQYIDGTIEWDHSSDGCFKEVERHD